MKALTPFEQCLNKCSFLLVCLFLVSFIHPLTLVRIPEFCFFSFLPVHCLSCCSFTFPLCFDTCVSVLLLSLLLSYSSCGLKKYRRVSLLSVYIKVVHSEGLMSFSFFGKFLPVSDERTINAEGSYVISYTCLKLHLCNFILCILKIVPLTFLLKGKRILIKFAYLRSDRNMLCKIMNTLFPIFQYAKNRS